MYTKLAIFSKNIFKYSVGWLGSANFTTAGFSGNQDNVWVSNDDDFVKSCLEQYDEIKQKSTPLRECMDFCCKKKKGSWWSSSR